MPNRTSIECFARLCAHWPALGGDDMAAEARARDWCAIIDKMDAGVAFEVCDQLVTGWAHNRSPRIADWNELARQVAIFQAIENDGPPELPAPEDNTRAEELIAAARAALVEREPAKGAVGPPPRHQRKEPVRGWSPKIDPNHRLPSYEDLYGSSEETSREAT